ncbi:LOW QUALITY PROTEIN: putative serine/threonine-protein kinase-like protein CCR3 [Dioscorea cayenensis subsp. rotundata]|uniref:non-specific serine/threonine protein kinase n=1 Tax=Dioscorea cayennensis subsp. rotundata TaxID=55577 RepID=A0AB40CD51_DIOCR|nr:LOW QUALITY PROTEIN: putative serine/threonine-protein kinase-like protein CCR3 [Dioscorea cayenensis subsp. rotundata]
MRVLLTVAVMITAIITLLFFSIAVDAFGSAATLAISSGTVCGIVSGASLPSISCNRVIDPPTSSITLSPNVSFSSISGGRGFICGIRSGGRSLLCWNISGDLSVKRIYNGSVIVGLSVGEDQIAAEKADGTGILFWRGDGSFENVNGSFRSLTSGRGFSCAIDDNSTVQCWGSRRNQIQPAYKSISMSSIVAGDSHVCGITTNGDLICKGSNNTGQINTPKSSPFEFSNLALGVNHSCAIRQETGAVLCWGGGGDGKGTFSPIGKTPLESIVAGEDRTCGILSANLSVICWGSNRDNLQVTVVPLLSVLPDICLPDQSSCSCGIDINSQVLCAGTGFICKPCNRFPPPLVPPPIPPPLLRTTRKKSKWNYASVIIGAVGGFIGVCSLFYLMFTCVCRREKVHNSVQPTTAPGAGAPSTYASPSASRSAIFIRQASRVMRRQRSGTSSSMKDRAELFTFAELAAATKNFSPENKIGAGSFGQVYKGQLQDGREVAIKRSETGPKAKKFQEKESAFQSELSFLSRLNHKHLVGLIGYCEEDDERLLVYDYMTNGALYDHLHSNRTNTTLDSWKLRIKVLLDAARGIEYLHNYAVPPIIHRDIKSSNILLDENWTARVSDFGLSLMGPATDSEHLSMKAAGTVGYMDPEYYGMQQLTVKSDVYGFGVVMLEMITGKRAIFKEEGDKESPTSVVDYAMPSIVAGDVFKVLDETVGVLNAQEAEAVELVAYTAVHCVSLEGRERPTMSDVVGNLESAHGMCQGSHVSISTASILSSD